MPTTKHWTSKDLETLPSPEGTRYEIIAGELFVSTQPHWHHQYTCGRLFRALDTWSDTHPLGYALLAPGLIFADDDDVAPDLVWVSHARRTGCAGRRRASPHRPGTGDRGDLRRDAPTSGATGR